MKGDCRGLVRTIIMTVVCRYFWKVLILGVGVEFELSREDVGTVVMDSTSLQCTDDDEWLDYPHVCGDGQTVHNMGH